MNRIRILDDDTVSKIAAGEVIERPASVVKELVENSIDAGAKRIEVVLKNGGKTLIRVADDGMGMGREDAVLSIRKHATSKLTKIDDLESLYSLGFRGEALSSICAAASTVEIVTKQRKAISGTRVTVQRGALVSVSDVGSPEGTAITVTRLFANTPARLKHLRPDKVEFAHIADIVSKYSLSYPGIAFILTHNDEESLRTHGDGKLISAISRIYGPQVAKQVLEVSLSHAQISISGHIGTPSLARASPDQQAVFVNRRWVKDHAISTAMRDAYGTMLPKGRHPYAVLFIDLPPAEVDVNVHPAKTEVRFVDEAAVVLAVKQACKDALGGDVERLYPEAQPKPQKVVTEKLGKSAGISVGAYVKPVQVMVQQRIGGNASINAEEINVDGPKKPSSEVQLPRKPASVTTQTKVVKGKTPRQSPKTQDGIPRVIGLAHGTYAVLESSDSIMLMDQHAAHERILYEQFQDGYLKCAPESQELITPVNVELTTKESAILSEYSGVLTRIGFQIEPFGRNTFSIRAVPPATAGPHEKDFIHDVIDDLLRESRGKAPGAIASERLMEIVAKRAATAACRAAVKAGDDVPLEDLQKIVKKLFSTANPYSCPHGRPVIITLTKRELERKFGRTG